jgi:hypothetical protein
METTITELMKDVWKQHIITANNDDSTLNRFTKFIEENNLDFCGSFFTLMRFIDLHTEETWIYLKDSDEKEWKSILAMDILMQ